nr:DUF5658 family protein [uncultured Methanoregula sp.]
MFAGRPGHDIHSPFPAYRPLDHGMIRRSVELLLVLGILFLLDIATTQIILRMGGVELNPLMTGIVANPALHLVLKAAILLVIFLVSLVAEQRVKGSGFVFYCILIVFYSAVVINNLFVILPQMAG